MNLIEKNYLLGAMIMYTMDYFENNVCCLANPEQQQNITIMDNKVLDIREKIKSGKYNVEEYLDIAIDRLLEDILVPKD